MKILAIGDTHGDLSSLCNIALPQAAKHDIKLIIQVGDFGYWEHTEEGRRFLDKLSKHLVRRDITLWWLDGNHENHPMLWSKYTPDPNNNGFMEIRENLWYMPRGSVFTLDNVRFLVLGGAFSIDKGWRLNRELMDRGHTMLTRENQDSSIREWAKEPDGHTQWWPTEMITDEDVEVAIKNAEKTGPIDVMLTHDCPTKISIPGIHSVDKWKYPQTWENRDRLQEVFDVVQPKLWSMVIITRRTPAVWPSRKRAGVAE